MPVKEVELDAGEIDRVGLYWVMDWNTRHQRTDTQAVTKEQVQRGRRKIESTRSLRTKSLPKEYQAVPQDVTGPKNLL